MQAAPAKDNANPTGVPIMGARLHVHCSFYSAIRLRRNRIMRGLKMRRPALLALGFLMLFAATATKAQMPNTIVTVAGGGTNSGAANTWTLTQPPDAVRDAAGNTYISDPILCVVYKVDTTGALSIYAGNGIFGVGGDGGPATSAGLTLPEGLALDGNGNLFIADYLNNRIRRVDVNTHVITTVAGSEDPFVGGYAGDGGLATLARLNLPFAVAVDKNGNLFISDSGNNVVRRVDAQTQIITTYAGNGLPGTPGMANGDGGAATAAQFNLPVGLVIDGNGNLYIADSQDSVIRLVNAQTQIITTYAGSPATQGTFGGDSGPATSAGLNTPSDIFLDGTGNLYIADTKNQRIRFVDNTTNHIITTIVGNGTLCMNPASACGDGAAATAAMLNHPTSVFLDSSGKLLIADQGDQRIRVVSAGTISNFAGGGPGGDGAAATSAILGLPNSLVVDSTGNLFVVEQLGERVRRLDATTHNMSTYAGTGARGERMSSNGDGGQAVNANFVAGFGIAIDGTGNIYVVDEKAAVVRKIDATTKIITTVAGNGLRCGEPGNPVVLPTCGDGGAATSASLFIPVAIALDSAGNLYISDVALNTIRIVNPSGTIQTFAGTPGPGCTTYATNRCGDGGPPTQALLNGPFGVAVGPSV
jgi:sugar lactone lactonase YvrE